jgi:hypothetical protein
MIVKRSIYRFLVGTPEQIENWEDLDVDECIILKWYLQECYLNVAWIHLA